MAFAGKSVLAAAVFAATLAGPLACRPSPPDGEPQVPSSDFVAPGQTPVRLGSQTKAMVTALARAHRERQAAKADLEGRVVDAAGAPLGGASITVIGLQPGDDEIGVVDRVLPLAAEAAGQPTSTLARPALLQTTTSDREGRFTIRDLPPGRFRMEITHDDKLPLHRAPIELVAGHKRLLGDLTLKGEGE